MRKTSSLQVILFLIALVLLTMPVFSANAYDINGYHITDYHTSIVVKENNQMEITEIITANFTGPNKHGIIRTIPTVFEKRLIYLENILVDHPYSVEKDRTYSAIRIGDANKIVSGEVKYRITYSYDYGDDLEKAFDKIYHNLLGTDWDCNIYNFTFLVQMPKDFDVNEINITYGPRYSQRKYTDYQIDGLSISGHLTGLSPNEGVTLAVKLPKGYFANTRQAPGLKVPVLYIMAPISIGLVIYLYNFWKKKGRDQEPIVAPQFYPIKGQSPAEAGYIIDEVVDNKDIVSLIFYWADKGYIKIIEEKRKFTFVKLKEANFRNSYESYIFNTIFSYGEGNEVSISDLKNNFYTNVPTIKKKIIGIFSGNRALIEGESLKNKQKALLFCFIPFLIFLAILGLEFRDFSVILISILLFFPFFAILLAVYSKSESNWVNLNNFKKLMIGVLAGLMVLFGFLIMQVYLEEVYPYLNTAPYSYSYFIILLCSSIGIALGVAMKKRSDYGQEMLEHYLGFKDFIATAEMDRLKILIDENPTYFYNVLPFAIVLGLEKKWARKFQSMIVEPPDWYSGYSMRTFSTVYLLSRMNTVVNQTNASMAAPPSTSSGSGFSSGGFSGGGGGGGGGSSW